jgi:hypothetical protein
MCLLRAASIGLNVSPPHTSGSRRRARRRKSPPRGFRQWRDRRSLSACPNNRRTLVTRDMMLAHHRRQPPFEPAKQIAEPAVAIALPMSLPIFLPEDHHRHAGALQFAREVRPVRLDPPPLARVSVPRRAPIPLIATAAWTSLWVSTPMMILTKLVLLMSKALRK